MSKKLYYEDFKVGDVIENGGYVITKEEAINFAKAYDPQDQHVDEELAKEGIIGELIASGWHTAAASMKLKLTSMLKHIDGGMIGMGLEQLKWPRPVFPGDTLRIVLTILEMRPSNSRPDRGVVKYRLETLNQKNEVVMEMITAVLVPRRPA